MIVIFLSRCQGRTRVDTKLVGIIIIAGILTLMSNTTHGHGRTNEINQIKTLTAAAAAANDEMLFTSLFYTVVANDKTLLNLISFSFFSFQALSFLCEGDFEE